MYERDLEQAYDELAATWRAVLAAGGPARCNGEWAKWAHVRAQVQMIEQEMAFEVERARSQAAAHPHPGP